MKKKTLLRSGLALCTLALVLAVGLPGSVLARSQTEFEPVLAQKGSLDSLRVAVEYLLRKYPGDYQSEWLEEVKRLEKRIGSEPDSPDGIPASEEEVKGLTHRALLAHPLLTQYPLVYVERRQYRPDHHNTATMFQPGEINAGSYDTRGVLKALYLPEGVTRTVYDPGVLATIRDLEVSPDGERILFSMRRNPQDSYHIYEVGLDGFYLLQLTAAPGVSDIDPIYLGDGSIVFSSTREPKYCMCNRHIMCNLYRMDEGGANIHQIGKSTLFEGHSSLTPDGRILYSRWEYVDRNFGDAQGLWVCNPDGTQHSIYWGNNTSSPGGVLDARIIPGTDLCLATFAACHDRPWGALAILNRNLGVDGKESVLQTWPADFIDRVSTTTWEDYDSTLSIPLKYEDPFPLDEHFFLASRMTGYQEETAIILLDTFGHEIVVHQDAPGCFDPMPAAPRKMPPVRPPSRNFEEKTGKFYVQNVYIGTHMKGVEPGAVKFLRVVESPEKRTYAGWSDGWFGQGEQAPAMSWHAFENKRILGTVPVEEDGSAYFEIPANRFVYFQLLDKEGMMIQSMRSGTILQPGEIQGCVGCHESRVGEAAPPAGEMPKAVSRPPSPMNGWYGEARLFNYLKEVQPVFTKNCVPCHDIGKKAGEKLVLAPDQSIPFNAAYTDMWRKGVIRPIGAGPAAIQEAYSWGSHASKVASQIRNRHNNVNLTPEEKDRVFTWIDLNAVYYPIYESAYPDSPCGRSPISFKDRDRLQQLTGIKISNRHSDRQAALVYFDRPEMSPILAKMNKESAEYKEALAIIQSGKEQLAARPRADMEGFVPSEQHRKMLEKYEERALQESKIHEAIREGKKVYDPGLCRR
ncbi:MAG TPA: hypothetical protein PLV91_03950 [Verrucomicrobiota bacterium]|nr:hypothetical protein [Verrucomicrobiota bacterium]